jgi:HAD superfamily phosphatase (TIGR01668 family)
MLHFLTPHLRIDRVQDLEPRFLRQLGFDGLLLDVDGTLVNWHGSAFAKEVADWLIRLVAADIRPCIVSNGNAARIAALAQPLQIPMVARAFKPLPHGCRRALDNLGLPPERAALVGDQVFADVLAGRLAGLYTVLVSPTSTVEPWFTRLKRPFERWLLRHLFPASPPPSVPMRLPNPSCPR